MTEQVKKPLPESLMKAIKAIVESPDATAWEKVEAAVLIAHGYGLFTKNDGSIDPMGYAIPEEQWQAISGLLLEVPADDITKVNYALTWMNVGPSGYKPEEG